MKEWLAREACDSLLANAALRGLDHLFRCSQGFGFAFTLGFMLTPRFAG